MLVIYKRCDPQEVRAGINQSRARSQGASAIHADSLIKLAFRAALLAHKWKREGKKKKNPTKKQRRATYPHLASARAHLNMRQHEMQVCYSPVFFNQNADIYQQAFIKKLQEKKTRKNLKEDLRQASSQTSAMALNGSVCHSEWKT